MPEGSSSLAPVTRPGPRARTYVRHRGPLDRVVSSLRRGSCALRALVARSTALATERLFPASAPSTGWRVWPVGRGRAPRWRRLPTRGLRGTEPGSRRGVDDLEHPWEAVGVDPEVELERPQGVKGREEGEDGWLAGRSCRLHDHGHHVRRDLRGHP